MTLTPAPSPTSSDTTISPPGRSGSRWFLPSLGSGGLVGVLVGLGLVWAYAPTLFELAQRWASDPNYSHGFFVPFIAAAIYRQRWLRFGELGESRVSPPVLWALPVLAVLLMVRSWLYDRNEVWFESVTLPFALAASALALAGWSALRVAWPAIVFLVFLFPLPARINALLADPLQRLATLGANWVLQAVGLPVLMEGNVLLVDTQRLEVAQACNGLSMLLSFVTLITAVAFLVERPLWERLFLLASAAPIALVTNILRIAVTAWCYQFLPAETVNSYAHDFAGYLMMPVALAIVGLELAALRWVIVETDAAPGVAPNPAPAVGTGRSRDDRASTSIFK